MHGFPAVGPGVAWFVAFPDRSDTAALVARLRSEVSDLTEVPHRTGNPWIVGRWAAGTVTVADMGEVRVAVLGEHTVEENVLRRETERSTDLATLLRDRAGSVHVVTATAGEIGVRGSATGLRRVFHGRAGDVAAAADRPDVLAWLAGSGVDSDGLALRLLIPAAPFPLSGGSVWTGVAAVAADHRVRLTPQGTARVDRWWTLPEPTLSLAEGAVQLREALTAAVNVRLRPGGTVAVDLAGLDSTALCSIAARGPAGVIAVTASSHDRIDDDLLWAKRTMAHLDGVEHRILPSDKLPLPFEGLGEGCEWFDEPFSQILSRSRFLATEEYVAGTDVHLVGLGGDEVLAGPPTWLNAYFRRNPAAAVRLTRGYCSLYGWSTGRALRRLMGRRSFATWLEETAAGLRERPDLGEPMVDWDPSPRLAPWVSDAAVDLVRDRLLSAARTSGPESRLPGMHSSLGTLRAGAGVARHFVQLAAHRGRRVSLPFYDDVVATAALAVRPHEKYTPWRYKPLIVEAMRGTAPDESLTRTTKPGFLPESEEGMRRHRDQLLTLVSGSRLADLGLVDADRFRHFVSGPFPHDLVNTAIDSTVACETWLRSIEPAHAMR